MMNQLVVFFALTFGISWTAYFLDWPLLFVFGPSIAGVILVQLTYQREERREFWRRVVDIKRISPGWYQLIILIFPALLALSILLDVFLGGSFPEMPLLARIAAQPLLVPLAVLEVMLRGPLSEELGWRGFALGAGLRRWGALRSSLVIGILWWAWHLPLFSWPSYGSAHYYWGWFSLMFWCFLVNVLTLSLLMTWVYLHNRSSILSAILIHFFFNLTLGLALPVSERVFISLSVMFFLVVTLFTRLKSTTGVTGVTRPVAQWTE